MKLFFKRMSYKLFVTSMIAIVLSFFVVTSFSHASKFKDLVNEDGIYYNGVQEAELTFEASLFDKCVNLLSKIITYVVGTMGLAVRGVAIGWFEIAEILLTAILNIDDSFIDVYTSVGFNSDYSDKIVTVEGIIFNKVEILNADIFENLEEATQTQSTTENKNDAKEVIKIIKNAVAKWYYILRLITIAFMLVLLIFVGIKMAFSTVASEKAVYKNMLIDWVAGMVLVFSIHYIMIAIFAVNNSIVDSLESLMHPKNPINIQEEYEYGIEQQKEAGEVETTLYESARTRAYSLKLTDGFTGMIIYGVLVYYAWRFAIMYATRVFNIIILTIMAPAIAVSYAFNKVLSGKAKIFSSWLSEYMMNVLIQMFHAIVYVSFVSVALELSLISLPGAILAFVILHFMLKSEKMLRTIFRLSGGKGGLIGNMEKAGFGTIKGEIKQLKTAVVGGTIGAKAMKATYRIATKPARAIAENAFGKYMEKEKDKQEEAERKRKELIYSLENDKNQLEETVETLKQNQKEIDDLESEVNILKQRKIDLNKREKQAKKDQTWYWSQQDEEGFNKKNNELDNMEKEKADVEKRLKKYTEEFEEKKKNRASIQTLLEEKQEELEEATDKWNYENQLYDLENLSKKFEAGTLKGTIGNLFDPDNYVQKERKWNEKTGQYEYKSVRVKTQRKGGVDGTFWREKKDSIGKRFMESAKLKNILNLSSAEEKQLKNQFKVTKSNILGVASGIIGFPALVVNPTLGIALLGQATNASLRMEAKRRQISNRPNYKKNKNYNFLDFKGASQYTMIVEAARQIKEAEDIRIHNIGERHQTFIQKLIKNNIKPITIPDLDPINSEKLSLLGYEKFNKQFKYALSDYYELEANMKSNDFKRRFEKKEKAEKEKIQKLTQDELIFNELSLKDNVIEVGDSLIEVEQEDKTEDIMDKLEKIDESLPSDVRIQKIKKIITDEKNRARLLESQMTKYFARRGIADIKNAKLTSEDILQIKQNFIGVLEDSGIIKKGELELDDSLISTTNVTDVFNKLVANSKKTNEELEDIIATDAVLEYMQINGYTSQAELKGKNDEIYEVIKDKITPESSKQTANVLKMMAGKQPEEVKLTTSMKLIADTKMKKVVTIIKKPADSEDSEELLADQITKYYAKKGVTKIDTVTITQHDAKEIKKNLIKILEEKGIVQKGSARPDDSFISTSNLSSTLNNLVSDSRNTNKKLEQTIATNAISEYMKQNGIKSQAELFGKTDEIFNVIKQLSEQKITGTTDLSDSMKKAVRDNMKIASTLSKDKDKLVEQEKNRRVNETKDQLEEALYTDSVEDIEDENTLEMLFLLSSIGENNRDMVHRLQKKKKSSAIQVENLKFYQKGNRRTRARKTRFGRDISLDQNGSRIVNINANEDLNQRNRLAKEEDLEKRLFGPSQNVIDLINNV